MKKGCLTLLFTLSMIAALGCGSLSYSTTRAQQLEGSRKPRSPAVGPIILLPPGGGEIVATQETERPKTNLASKKWEYCAITGFASIEKGFRTYTPVAVIRYFPNVIEQVEGTSQEDAQANAVAKLGDEGWEMVGVAEPFTILEGNGRNTSVFYFKRAK
ncbi:MAG TPA: hypothetical protein VM866_02060 [Pyrinomonadaceae bacterium]|nr:hypothetical protein [Pyrinomonadaceae bacterium]